MSKLWWLLPIVALTVPAFAEAPPPARRTDVERRTALMFDRADTNHDGMLSKAEYRAITVAIAKARGGTPTPQGLALVDAQFDAVDTSHSGRISRADFIARQLAEFDAIDLNHDGIVNERESSKAATLLRRQMKAQSRH